AARADARLWGSGPPRHTDGRACEGSITFRHDQAVLDESNKYAVRDNDNVDGFTTSQSIRDGGLLCPYGRCGGHEFFLRKQFDAGNELKICRGKSTRGHDPDVICHGIHGWLNIFSCTFEVIVAVVLINLFVGNRSYPYAND